MKIGYYKIMDGIGYLTINNQGTLKKMGRVKWYYALVLELKQCIHGKVEYSLVESFVEKTTEKEEMKRKKNVLEFKVTKGKICVPSTKHCTIKGKK
jgi:hypothetical protein